MNVLAATWLAWPCVPKTEAMEEKTTKWSSARSRVSSCRNQLPSTLGERTVLKRAQSRRDRGASSSRPARWNTPASGMGEGSRCVPNASARAALSVTSTCRRRTSHPVAAIFSTAAAPAEPASGRRRPSSHTCPAPRAARWAASARPRSLRPPVTR